MREIKFRAWSTGKNNLLKQERMISFKEISQKWHLYQFLNPDSYGVILMQYTGLKDKNGVEIYEGDIVNYTVKKTYCGCEGEQEIYHGINKFCPSCGKEVEEKDFITTCEIVYMNGGFTLCKKHDDDYYTAWQTFIAEIYIEWKEVIGNIYQNHELL